MPSQRLIDQLTIDLYSTLGFLKKNNLDYIIRSHEHVQMGYDLMHNGKSTSKFAGPSKFSGFLAFA
jgi:hypothetical protein